TLWCDQSFIGSVRLCIGYFLHISHISHLLWKDVLVCYLARAVCLGGIWIGRPSVARTASRSPSLSVGCGWIVSMISSAVSSLRIATEYSVTRFVASGPMICAPRISLYLPRMTLVKPSACALPTALPLAAHGKRSIRTWGF